MQPMSKKIRQSANHDWAFWFVLCNNAPVGKNWRVELEITHERKYDFVNGGKQTKLLPVALSKDVLPLEKQKSVVKR